MTHFVRQKISKVNKLKNLGCSTLPAKSESLNNFPIIQLLGYTTLIKNMVLFCTTILGLDKFFMRPTPHSLFSVTCDWNKKTLKTNPVQIDQNSFFKYPINFFDFLYPFKKEVLCIRFVPRLQGRISKLDKQLFLWATENKRRVVLKKYF